MRITHICYLSAPWNDPFMRVEQSAFCLEEHNLFLWHVQKMIRWERAWKAYNDQPEHQFFGDAVVPHPGAMPLCTCWPLLDPVVDLTYE